MTGGGPAVGELSDSALSRPANSWAKHPTFECPNADAATYTPPEQEGDEGTWTLDRDEIAVAAAAIDADPILLAKLLRQRHVSRRAAAHRWGAHAALRGLRRENEPQGVPLWTAPAGPASAPRAADSRPAQGPAVDASVPSSAASPRSPAPVCRSRATA